MSTDPSIDSRYGAYLKPQQTTLLIRSFLFGMATYCILFLLYPIFGEDFDYPSFSKDSDVIDLTASTDEILFSIPLSLVLSCVWLFAVRYRVLMRFLHIIRATRRFGDEDVWSFTLNSDQAHVEYVHFRDLENGYIFAGWINTFSENEDYRELLLRDVIVYNEEGEEIYATPRLYISRPKDQIWLEFPFEE